MSAPYTGGSDPGSDLFYCENFSIATPCGTPRTWNPFQGDSTYGSRDIILLNSSNAYVRVPAGQGYNYQPWSAAQSCLMFDQEFMVARSHFVPLPLNTPYYVPWSTGWRNTYVNLASCFLIEEGPLQNVGGGLVKFYRRFCNLPPTRSLPESYCANFPKLTYGSGKIRFPITRIVDSRIQFDYFVFDALNLLGGIPLFSGSASGRRLNGSTGINPPGLILPEMRYFKGETDSVLNNNQIDPGQPLIDGTGSDLSTIPSYSEYADFAGFTGIPRAEIVAESSSLRQWAGNIYERRTRFVVAE